MVLTLGVLAFVSGGACSCYRPRASVANSRGVLVSLGFIVAYASCYLIVIVRLTYHVLSPWSLSHYVGMPPLALYGTLPMSNHPCAMCTHENIVMTILLLAHYK